MPELDTTNWRNEKIITLEDAAKKADEARNAGKLIVTVNGSFDILHAGHLDQLEEAKKQGEILFIGLNSDKSVQAGKGKDRPYITEQARAAMLAALICTDYIIIIDEAYKAVPNVLLRAIKPDVHVNGGDYGSPEKWIEWPVMQEIGAVGYSVQHRNSFSTTDLVKKIKGTS